MRTAFQGLKDWNTCSSVRAVCKCLGVTAWLEEVHHLRWDLRVYRLTVFPVCFLCFEYVAEDVVSQLPALLSYSHAFHTTRDSPETINPTRKRFLPQDAFVIVFYHKRKVTNTECAFTENLQRAKKKKNQQNHEVIQHLETFVNLSNCI